MAEASSGGCRGESGSRLAGVSGILFGILLIATFASSYNFPSGPAQADATLAQFSSFRSAFLAGDIFIGLAAVIAIPYFVGLRAAFNGKDRLLVGSATLMGDVGIVVTAAVFIGEAIGTVEVFGFLTLAAGFAVYGFTTIQGRPFPRWLGYVGILGAVLFLLGAVPVSGAFTAIFAGTVLILVWIFATSVLMWKSGAPRATP